MRLPLRVLAAAFALALSALPAAAALLISIDKTTQRMSVEMDGQEIFNWPVSTGTRGYDTPSGSYKPFRMEADHFSREWDDAPMPHSIFFTQVGHAIHGTTHTKAIGSPASHGCVRLEPQNAEALFKLVKQEKMANTRIVLTGTTPAPPPVAAAPPNDARRQARPEARSLPQDDFTGALAPRDAKRCAIPTAKTAGAVKAIWGARTAATPNPRNAARPTAARCSTTGMAAPMSTSGAATPITRSLMRTRRANIGAAPPPWGWN